MYHVWHVAILLVYETDLGEQLDLWNSDCTDLGEQLNLWNIDCTD